MCLIVLKCYSPCAGGGFGIKRDRIGRFSCRIIIELHVLDTIDTFHSEHNNFGTCQSQDHRPCL